MPTLANIPSVFLQNMTEKKETQYNHNTTANSSYNKKIDKRHI